MAALNFKHLRYFWMVAKSGSIARACEQLHLTPQAISGQLRELEEALGVELFRRAGRGLELTDAGRRILSYAEEIFSLGDELLEVARDQTAKKSLPFSVGIADSVPKSVAHRLVEPALHLPEAVRLDLSRGTPDRTTRGFGRPSPRHGDRRPADAAQSECPRLQPPARRKRSQRFRRAGFDRDAEWKFSCPAPRCTFPAAGRRCRDPAAARTMVRKPQRLHPRIVGEFDDSALLKSFGQAGAGLFVAPTAIAGYVADQYRVSVIGRIDSISEQLFAITTERRLSHPAIVAIIQVARDEVFGGSARDPAVAGDRAHSRPLVPARAARSRGPSRAARNMP